MAHEDKKYFVVMNGLLTEKLVTSTDQQANSARKTNKYVYIFVYEYRIVFKRQRTTIIHTLSACCMIGKAVRF